MIEKSPVVGIMQPYFLPYIGYFQLMNKVDKFVIYDNIKYTKKGWINRNRILVNQNDSIISIPLSKGSDNLDIVDRCISDSFSKTKLLNKISAAYRKAPCFHEGYELVEKIVNFNDSNLFSYLYNSIETVAQYLGINTELIVSSSIDVGSDVKGQDRVIETCLKLNAKEYINPIGGLDLYDRDIFKKSGINIKFIKSKDFRYEQFGSDFVPWLSILDIIMFNSREEITGNIINKCELV